VAKSAPQYLNLGGILVKQPVAAHQNASRQRPCKEIEPAFDRLEITNLYSSISVTDAPPSEEDLAGAPARSWTEARFDAVVLARALASRCLAHCSAPANGSRGMHFGLACCRSRDCLPGV